MASNARRRSPLSRDYPVSRPGTASRKEKTMDIEERIAKVRAANGAQTQAAPVEKKARAEQLKPEVQAKEAPSSE